MANTTLGEGVSYKPLISDMTWSFSRVESFNSCPYKWFLKYIRGWKENGMFYASYGTLMHEIIRKYYDGELTKPQMLIYFLTHFKKDVVGERPSESTVQKYIDAGVTYCKNFEPFPYNTVAVEKTVDFNIDGISFVGILDYIGEKEGKYCIVDNKSRELKPRSGRAKPTKKDEELDNMLKQLYIYSEGVHQLFGKYPDMLAFNCFRNGVFIEEPFKMDKFISAKEWVKNEINRIENEPDFAPNPNQFACKWLCGFSHKCIYDASEEWRRINLHEG